MGPTLNVRTEPGLGIAVDWPDYPSESCDDPPDRLYERLSRGRKGKSEDAAARSSASKKRKKNKRRHRPKEKTESSDQPLHQLVTPQPPSQKAIKRGLDQLCRTLAQSLHLELTAPPPSPVDTPHRAPSPRRKSSKIRVSRKAEAGLCSLLKGMNVGGRDGPDTPVEEPESTSDLPAVSDSDVRLDPRAKTPWSWSALEDLPVQLVTRSEMADSYWLGKKKHLLKKAKKKQRKLWKRQGRQKKRLSLRASVLDCQVGRDYHASSLP